MKKKKAMTAKMPVGKTLDMIKRKAIVAMFADDELMDLLVLKGGNAIDIVHQVHLRSSVDIDFSAEEFDFEGMRGRIKRSIESTFELESYHAFDIGMKRRPGTMPDELAAFWGGYQVEFKLISINRADEVERDIERMRREAIKLGEGTKFIIDISNHEFIGDKQEDELDGYRIYVYTPEMIVSEKLRAICQQMPEYAEIIQRKGLGNQRARDFIDIEALIKKFDIDLMSERIKNLVREMFAIKRVPLPCLGKIKETRDFHVLGYDEVRAAIRPGVTVEPFDYYFDFVVEQCEKLKSLWDV